MCAVRQHFGCRSMTFGQNAILTVGPRNEGDERAARITVVTLAERTLRSKESEQMSTFGPAMSQLTNMRVRFSLQSDCFVLLSLVAL
jgi:hypothetical protein